MASNEQPKKDGVAPNDPRMGLTQEMIGIADELLRLGQKAAHESVCCAIGSLWYSMYMDTPVKLYPRAAGMFALAAAENFIEGREFRKAADVAREALADPDCSEEHKEPLEELMRTWRRPRKSPKNFRDST